MFRAEDIKDRLREQPFVPLRIFTSSGQSYDVTHPDLVLVGRNYLYVGVASNDNPTVFDTASRVFVLHVTDMQEIPRTAASDAAGGGAAS